MLLSAWYEGHWSGPQESYFYGLLSTCPSCHLHCAYFSIYVQVSCQQDHVYTRVPEWSFYNLSVDYMIIRV